MDDGGLVAILALALGVGGTCFGWYLGMKEGRERVETFCRQWCNYVNERLMTDRAKGLSADELRRYINVIRDGLAYGKRAPDDGNPWDIPILSKR